MEKSICRNRGCCVGLKLGSGKGLPRARASGLLVKKWTKEVGAQIICEVELHKLVA